MIKIARKREGFSIDDLVQISKAGGKRFVRYDEGKMLYSMGRNRFIELAKNANARYKVNGVTLCDTQAIDEYIIENCKLEDEYYF